jgi:hypothetical protein
VKTNRVGAAPKTDLDPSEWDFRKEKVPTAEIEPCFTYEYARELGKRSGRLTKLLAKWKGGRGAAGESPKSDEASRAHSAITSLLAKCFDTTVHIDDDFPNTTWQNLDTQPRLAIIAGVSSGRLNVSDAPLAIKLVKDRTESAPNFDAFRAMHGMFRDNPGRSQYGFIAIDWSFSDGAIKRAFDKSLLSQRPVSATRSTGKRKTRGGFRDQLNLLGALRLFEHYGAKGLLKKPSDPFSGIKFAAAPYGNLSDLYEAKSKAEKLLRWLLDLIARS